MSDSISDQTERFQLIARWFEQLTAESLNEIESLYASRARFVDPFNDLQGVALVRQVFEHMFKTLEQPRFVVTRLA